MCMKADDGMEFALTSKVVASARAGRPRGVKERGCVGLLTSCVVRWMGRILI